jgi:hypothetical protein
MISPSDTTAVVPVLQNLAVFTICLYLIYPSLSSQLTPNIDSFLKVRANFLSWQKLVDFNTNQGSMQPGSLSYSLTRWRKCCETCIAQCWSEGFSGTLLFKACRIQRMMYFIQHTLKPLMNGINYIRVKGFWEKIW